MTRLDPVTWNLRRWLLLASALTVAVLLTACGGGEEPDGELAGPPAPTWECWMQQAPCKPASAPTTRLIEPPRDTRSL